VIVALERQGWLCYFGRCNGGCAMGELVAQDVVTGRFLPGNSGGRGRPKGSHHKFSDAFCRDLYDDWLAHGIQVIQEIRETRPAEYLRICAVIAKSYSDFGSITETIHSDAIAELIEERRKLAQAMIEQMKASDGKCA
jgi:hypothetical protein